MARIELKQSEFVLLVESLEYYYRKASLGLYSSKIIYDILEKIDKYSDLSDTWKKEVKELISKIKKEQGWK